MGTMTAAQIAATRHLLGLSQGELAAALGVNRHAVKDWESGRFTARPGVVDDLTALRRVHDQDTATAVREATAGVVLELPREPRPQGWYLAVAARVIAAVPAAEVTWQEHRYTATTRGRDYHATSRVGVAEQIYGEGVAVVPTEDQDVYMVTETADGMMQKVIARLLIREDT